MSYLNSYGGYKFKNGTMSLYMDFSRIIVVEKECYFGFLKIKIIKF